ncbi:MAG: hypothetical protein ACJKSS_01065 [Patescibacteria group bacterium UBA2103]
MAQTAIKDPVQKYVPASSGRMTLLPTEITSSLPGHLGQKALMDAGAHFHDMQEGYEQLRWVDLPAGWTVQDLGPRKGGLFHANVLDEKGFVRAVTRQYKYLNGIGRGEVGGWSQMIVACPYILSFQRGMRGDPVPRIRKRYGGTVYTSNMRPKPGEPLGAFKARAREDLFDTLNQQFPNWKTELCS